MFLLKMILQLEKSSFFFEKFKSDTLMPVKKPAKREVSLNNLVLHFSILFLFLCKIIGKE